MKKLMLLLAALFFINCANAQVGLAFNNYTTTCPFRVTLYAHDGTNTACNYYTSTSILVTSGVSLWSWAMLCVPALWGGTPPDQGSVVIDGFCADFDIPSCAGFPACAGDPTCGWPGINNTLSSTCGCNNNKTVLIGFNSTYYNGSLYTQCKIGQ